MIPASGRARFCPVRFFGRRPQLGQVELSRHIGGFAGPQEAGAYRDVRVGAPSLIIRAMNQVISGALAPSEERLPAVAPCAQHISPGLVAKAALTVFTGHSLPILFCGLLCFVSVTVVGALSYLAFLLHGLASQGNYFALTTGAFYLQMQIQAAIGAFTFLIGRGAITWIALHAPADANSAATGRTISLRAALSAALQRWRPLLVSSLLYGLLVTIGLVGVTWMLREARLDVSNYRLVRRDAQGILNLILVRGIAQLPPDPGSPFTELHSAARYHLRRQGSSYPGWLLSRSALPNLSAPPLAAGIAGASFIFLTEALLCMRTAHIMHTPNSSALRWLVPVLRLGLSNFWRIAAWRWGLRLIMVVLYVACLTLPITLHQAVVVPAALSEAPFQWWYWLRSVISLSYAAISALIGMFLIAFGLVFEARMYLALVGERPPRPLS